MRSGQPRPSWHSLSISSRVQLGRVLELHDEELLAYSWTDSEYQGKLDSVVTWTLRPEGHGTRLFVEHRGFDSDDTIQQAGPQVFEALTILSGLAGWWAPVRGSGTEDGLGTVSSQGQGRDVSP
ncbi:MAG TPA: SRPBCC domain-containing protein [Pseudonocardiaceae bacterium]